jgi:glycosyltransferase involved in cell wall biosynthesis
MKIIFSSFDDMKNPYYGGGGAFSVHEVAKRLTKNHQVTILTGRYPNSKDEYVDGVFYKRISFFETSPKLCQLIFQFCLPFYLMKMDFDVWFESYTPPFSTAFLPLFTKKRVIGVTHLLGGKEMAKHYKLPFHLIERVGLKMYPEVIVMNESLKQQVLDANKNCKIEIIPNGETQDLINRQNDNREEEYLLFLGRIDAHHKGLDYLLEIYKNVADRIGMDLVIAGGGMQAEVDSLKIKQLGLESKVRLVGKVSGQDKIDTFRKAKIFAMTSRIEAFPRVLLENFCYEVPTIIFNIDVLTWVPENVSIKVKPFDTKEFEEKLLALNADAGLRQQLAKNAKEFVKNFDWEKIAEQYEQVIIKS